MAEVTRTLLVLICASHASASCGIQKANVIETLEEGLVTEKEFPWVVSLQDAHHTHLAFGSILSEFWILSIASAFQHRKRVYAIVGIASLDARAVSHEEYPASTIVPHEAFDNKTMANDIALLRTDAAMRFGSLVGAICFLGRWLQMPLAWRNCWVAGWNPTFATGNHMTMSILRKISMQDSNLCPSHRFKKIGCGSHMEEETNNVCLGDPGNPLMCQLQQSDLWVLRGVLSKGGERCPGLLLYSKVEDYSDWIKSRTRIRSPPLSAFQHHERRAPSQHASPHTTETWEGRAEPSRVTWPQTRPPEQKERSNITLFVARAPWPGNSSAEGGEAWGKGARESGSSPEETDQPTYYDYYSGHEGGRGSVSGQDTLCQPQEMILFWSVFVVFCSGR